MSVTHISGILNVSRYFLADTCNDCFSCQVLFSLQEIKKQLFIDIFRLHLTAKAVITEFTIKLCHIFYIQNATNVCCTQMIFNLYFLINPTPRNHNIRNRA